MKCFAAFLLTLLFLHVVNAQDTEYIDTVHHIYVTGMLGSTVHRTDNGFVIAPIDSNKIIRMNNSLMKYFDSVPLSHPYANSEGSYMIVANADKEIIDPGELIKFEIYFTGYGFAERSKVFFATSSDFYDTSYSQVFTDATVINNQLIYGIDSNYLSPYISGKIFSMGGGQFTGYNGKIWKKPTPYFDIHPFDEQNGTISSEAKLEKAPLEFHLKTKDNIAAGTYSVHFVYTYYDGLKWRNDEQTVSFQVRTWTDIHWKLLLWLTVILGSPPIIEFLLKYNIITFFIRRFKANKNTLLTEEGRTETESNDVPQPIRNNPNPAKKIKPKGKSKNK